MVDSRAGLEIVIDRHLPVGEALLSLGVEPLGADVPPEWRVVALDHVVGVDEGAKIVDLAPDPGVVVVAVGIT